MSSTARLARRGARARKIAAPNPLEPASRRNGRVKAAQPHRASVSRVHPRIGWYAGLAVMAIIEIIEWRLAIVMMLGHEVAHRTHRRALRDFAEGIEAGA